LIIIIRLIARNVHSLRLFCSLESRKKKKRGTERGGRSIMVILHFSFRLYSGRNTEFSMLPRRKGKGKGKKTGARGGRVEEGESIKSSRCFHRKKEKHNQTYFTPIKRGWQERKRCRKRRKGKWSHRIKTNCNVCDGKGGVNFALTISVTGGRKKNLKRREKRGDPHATNSSRL